MANMNFGVNILPKANNTYSLGNSDYKWNIFANSINGTAIGNLTLPAVTSSNNGQILQVSNGAWAVGAAPSGLPSITSSDNGKILQVSSGTWAAATLSLPTKVSDLTNDSGFLTTVPTMIGATSSAAGTAGLAPAPTTGDVDKFLAGDGTYKSGGLPMVILSYGNSTWTDFINAYNNNVIVYCRASSNSNPASGSQTRMAFMAYVNNAKTPTEVEFQYYRSMNAHSATAMGDQVFVYKLNKNNGWSVTTRDASIKQIKIDKNDPGTVSWSGNVVTLKSGLPKVTSDDEGKILKVVNGVWTAVDP